MATAIPFSATRQASEQDTAGEREVLPARLYRLSVEQYHEMIERNILTEAEPIELLEGVLVEKMGKKRPHSLTTRLLRDLLSKQLPEGFYIDSQEPVTTSDSEPEPDILVVRGVPQDYLRNHPRAADVPFVVEVAEATIYRDRTFKKRIYARAGISVYWIVNLIDRQIEVHTQPSGPAEQPDYGDCQIIAETGEVGVVIDGREVAKIAVKDLLP